MLLLATGLSFALINPKYFHTMLSLAAELS
jgi:hypothetical protein